MLPDPEDHDIQQPQEAEEPKDCISQPVQIQTFPELFAETWGGPFRPAEGVELTRADMISLQLMYAARQVLTALCKEMGYLSLAEEPLFHIGGVPGVYSELMLLSSMINSIMVHALVFYPQQPTASSALRVWDRFKECMVAYAPWSATRLPDPTAWKHEIARVQGLLEDFSQLFVAYMEAKARFEADQKE